LKASLGDAVKQKSEVCKHEQFERQTVIDPIPALLVCALPDGPLNLAAAHGRHHENRHIHSKFSTSRMVGDHLGSLRPATPPGSSWSTHRYRGCCSSVSSYGVGLGTTACHSGRIPTFRSGSQWPSALGRAPQRSKSSSLSLVQSRIQLPRTRRFIPVQPQTTEFAPSPSRVPPTCTSSSPRTSPTSRGNSATSTSS